jgi:hypothetical protein
MERSEAKSNRIKIRMDKHESALRTFLIMGIPVQPRLLGTGFLEWLDGQDDRVPVDLAQGFVAID